VEKSKKDWGTRWGPSWGGEGKKARNMQPKIFGERGRGKTKKKRRKPGPIKTRVEHLYLPSGRKKMFCRGSGGGGDISIDGKRFWRRGKKIK